MIHFLVAERGCNPSIKPVSNRKKVSVMSNLSLVSLVSRSHKDAILDGHAIGSSHADAKNTKSHTTPKTEHHSARSTKTDSTVLSSQNTNSSSRSRSSELLRKACLTELKIEQACREAKQHTEEERKQAEEEFRIKEKKRLQEEQRKIRDLEYEAVRLRLEAKLEFEEERDDPESLANRLRDFDDVKEEELLLPEKPLEPLNETRADPPSFPPPVADPLITKVPVQSSTQQRTPPLQDCNEVPLKETLNDSWVGRFSEGPSPHAHVNQTSAFAKSPPHLDLPRFSGSPLEWPHFISMFKCLVHDMPLTDTQQMTYLQRALVGEVKRAIGGMLNHGHLYRNTLTELEEQFGKEEVIAGAYLRTIFDHSKVAEDDLSQLQSLYNTIHIAVETLKGLRFTSNLEATDNVRRAVQKLRNSLKARWGEAKVEMSPRVPSLQDLNVWLRARVRTKTSVAEYPAGRKPPKPPFRPDGGGTRRPLVDQRKPKETPPLTTLAMNANDGNKIKPEGRLCPICAHSHKIEECDTFKALNVDQRAQLAKEKSLCFRCLTYPTHSEHFAKICNLRGRCKIDNCNRHHHPLIHGAAPVFTGIASVDPDTTVLLQIVPISLRTPKGVFETYALLDSGSQASLILEDFAERVGLQGKESVLHLGTIDAAVAAKPSHKVAFNVGAVGGTMNNEIKVEQAWTIPHLNLPSQRVTHAMINSWPHLNGLNIPVVNSKDVTVLLGANVLDAILHKEARQGAKGQPVAVHTAFGWTLTGAVKGFVPPEKLHVMFIQRIPTADDQLNQQLQNWWRTDSFGTKYQYITPRSRDDKKALEILESTVKHVGDRYEAGLLWKDKDVQLSDNRDVADKRLRSTKRIVTRDAALAEKYCGIIKEYETKGYARKLTPEEAATPSPKQWFLPHNPVLNPNKPGKVRMVMDAAAKKNGVSLNDNLLVGPDLLNSLAGVLMRFREERVAIAADIEAMFHQCRIIEEDQPALRFLWRNLKVNRSPDVYQMCIVIFGATSSPCTATYVLCKTADDNRGDPMFSSDTMDPVFKNF